MTVAELRAILATLPDAMPVLHADSHTDDKTEALMETSCVDSDGNEHEHPVALVVYSAK